MTIQTNNTQISVVKETSLGVAPTTGWLELAPNTIPAFGETTTTAAQRTLSASRQRKEGSAVDRDAAVSLESNFRLDVLDTFAEGIMFARGVRREYTEMPLTSLAGTTLTFNATAFSIANDKKQSPASPAPTAFAAGDLPFFPSSTLLYVNGDRESEGIYSVTTAPSTGDTTLTVGTTVKDKLDASATIGSGAAYASLVGARIAQGAIDTAAYDNATREISITFNANHTFAAQGLTVGQMVHFGSIDFEDSTPRETVIKNAFQTTAANDSFGRARVKSMTATTIVFDKVEEGLMGDGTAAITYTLPTNLDMMFSEFYRNVPTTSEDYRNNSYQFEAEYTRDEVPAGQIAQLYEYGIGQKANTMAIGLAGQSLATLTTGFIGQDSVTIDPNIAGQARKAGPDSAREPIYDAAMTTGPDLARLRLTDLDDSGLTTDFRSLNVTIANNISPAKFLGKLGAQNFNIGLFFVDITTEVQFTDTAVVEAVRNNQTVTFDFAIENKEGMVIVDIPSLNISGGNKNLNVDDTISINLTGSATDNNDFDTSLHLSVIRVPMKI